MKILRENKKIKGLISQKTAGLFLVSGLFLIMLFQLFFYQPITVGLALIVILILVVVFLNNPLAGLFLLLIIRITIDKIGNDYSVQIGQNFSLNINALLGIILTILALGYIIFLRKKLNKSFLLIASLWIIYLSISAISLFWSIEKFYSVYELLRLISIFSIFWLGYLVTRKKKPETIFKLILWSAVIPLVVATYQFLTETGMGRIAGLKSRLFGTFSDPNSFAAFLLIIIAIIAYFIIKNTRSQKAISFNKKSLFLGFLILILIATFSRGGWLALLIFSILVSIFKNPKFLAIVFGCLILLTLTIEPLRDRTEDIYNPPVTSSIYWRFQQWDKMYRLFKKQLWTGYGLGTETVVHEKEFGFYAGNPYTHNDILKNALETGIYGALSYTLLFLSTIVVFLFNYFKQVDRKTKNAILIILILFIAEIGFSMTSNILRSTAIQWIIWFLVGSGLALCSTKKSAKNQ